MSGNRDRIRDPREEILLETNFDEDGALTRAYNNNNSNPTRRQNSMRSEYSVDRYSTASLHGNRRKGRFYIKKRSLWDYLTQFLECKCACPYIKCDSHVIHCIFVILIKKVMLQSNFLLGRKVRYLLMNYTLKKTCMRYCSVAENLCWFFLDPLNEKLFS